MNIITISTFYYTIVKMQCGGKAQCHMILYHSKMLICCSRNISYYCWKQL